MTWVSFFMRKPLPVDRRRRYHAFAMTMRGGMVIRDDDQKDAAVLLKPSLRGETFVSTRQSMCALAA